MADSRARRDDGRVARRLENRNRIVDALFALIQSGRFHPTLKEVADRAGVTSRTLLNHFPDGASLREAAVERGRELAETTLPPVPVEGSPEERVLGFMREAASFFDRYSAIRWSALTARDQIESTTPRKGMVLRRVEGRAEELVASFGVDVGADPELSQAVRVVIDPLSWRLLRVHQGLSRDAAAAAMARTLTALARDAVARAGASKPKARVRSS